MSSFKEAVEEEIRLYNNAIFYCSYCGERIDKKEPIILRQDRHNFVEIIHVECKH